MEDIKEKKDADKEKGSSSDSLSESSADSCDIEIENLRKLKDKKQELKRRKRALLVEKIKKKEDSKAVLDTKMTEKKKKKETEEEIKFMKKKKCEMKKLESTALASIADTKLKPKTLYEAKEAQVKALKEAEKRSKKAFELVKLAEDARKEAEDKKAELLIQYDKMQAEIEAQRKEVLNVVIASEFQVSESLAKPHRFASLDNISLAYGKVKKTEMSEEVKVMVKELSDLTKFITDAKDTETIARDLAKVKGISEIETASALPKTGVSCILVSTQLKLTTSTFAYIFRDENLFDEILVLDQTTTKDEKDVLVHSISGFGWKYRIIKVFIPDPSVLYVKIDDTVLFLEKDAIKNLIVVAKLNKDKYMCYAPNCVNTGFCDYLHDQSGKLGYKFHIRKNDDGQLYKPGTAEMINERFINEITGGTFSNYKFADTVIPEGDYWTPCFYAFFGSKPVEVKHATSVLKAFKDSVLVSGNIIASHYAFEMQITAGFDKEKKIFDIYRAISSK